MKKKLLIPLFLAGIAIPTLASKNEIQCVDAAFIGEFGEREAYIEHATKVATQLAEEGFVLLKNDGTLPLKKGSKITLAGKASVDMVRGGQGAGSMRISSGVNSYDFEKSLDEAGFTVNKTALEFYRNVPHGRTNGNFSWSGYSEVTIGEVPIENILQDNELLDSFREYNDLAIQVIGREGSEGCDILTIDATDSTKFGQSEKHALELSDNEQALFDELHNNFDNILIIINSSNIFECDQFMDDPKVAGILWVGNPGDVGPKAIGEIISGDVNPSGRTVDTWTRDFTKDPTFQNFSDNRQNTGVIIPQHKGRMAHQSADTMFNADGTPMRDYGVNKTYTDTENPSYIEEPEYKVVAGGLNGVRPASFISYEEGIYTDYRYYETRYADMCIEEGKRAADEWYNSDEGVVFPFGYGESYTTFDQKIVRVNPSNNSIITEKDDLVEVSVKITNTGPCAGKDVVQLYWKAPYTKGGIEKANHVLCAFGKSDVIQPGNSEYVHLTFHLQDVANYDYNDANNNRFVGYELEAGNYEILCMENAHELYDSADLIIPSGGIMYEKDRFTNSNIENRFTNRGVFSSLPGEDDINFTEMSRANFARTFPSYPTFEDRTVKNGSKYEEYLTTPFDLAGFEKGNNYEFVPEGAHKTAEDGVDWRQTGEHSIMLNDMKGYDLSDPKWETFINEFSWDDLMVFVEEHKMGSPSLKSIGKENRASEGDGVQQFRIMAWVSSPIIAATYNQNLVFEQGECIGLESYISNYYGMWGTAVNIHRSPFGGRNFEYYSADPFLTGRIGALVTKAVTDKGVYCYVKHFAVNEQEKNREGLCTFVSEQALREIYLKPFQMAVEEGKTVGIFGSYNRLGLKEICSNYPLLTEVLRGEWGFRGSVLSDMTHSANSNIDFKCYECVTWRVLAGCNCQLDSGGFGGQVAQLARWDATVNGGKGAPVCVSEDSNIAWSLWGACRDAVKQHLHMIVNSGATERTLAKIVGQTTIDVIVGENVEINVAKDLKKQKVEVGSDVEIYSGGNRLITKQISSIDRFEINDRCVLPEGFALNESTGVISGQFSNIQLARIDVIINVTFTDYTEGQIAYKYVLNAKPYFEPLGVIPPNPQDEEEEETPTVIVHQTEKCRMSIGRGSIFISSLTLIGALLIVLNKKRNK